MLRQLSIGNGSFLIIFCVIPRSLYLFHFSEGFQLVLEGRHNADIGWISELRTNGNVLV